MPRLIYPQLTDISTEAALRNHYASVGARLGRGAVKSVQDVARPHAKWTAPEIQELKAHRGKVEYKRLPSPELHRERIRVARRQLTAQSSEFEVLKAVAMAWSVSITDMIGTCREPDLLTPRGIAMTLCRRLIRMRGENIAVLFSNRSQRAIYKQIGRYAQLVDEALATVGAMR